MGFLLLSIICLQDDSLLPELVQIAIYMPSSPLIIDAPQLLMPAGSWTVFLG